MGWLVFASVVLAVIVGGWQARRRHVRQRQLMHLSHKTGLKFMPMDPFTDTMWLPFRVFGKGSRRGTENVLWDPRDDPSDVRAFDYWWVEENPEAKGSGPANRITCAVASLPFTCPRLEVLPQGSVEAAGGGGGAGPPPGGGGERGGWVVGGAPPPAWWGGGGGGAPLPPAVWGGPRSGGGGAPPPPPPASRSRSWTLG